MQLFTSYNSYNQPAPTSFLLFTFSTLQDAMVQHMKCLLVASGSNSHPKQKCLSLPCYLCCHLECRIAMCNCEQLFQINQFVKMSIIFALSLLLFLTVSLPHKTLHLYKDSTFLYLRDLTSSCHRHNFHYLNNIKTRSIQHSRQKCYLTFEFVLTTINASTQLEEDQALMLLFSLSKPWESLNEGE